MIIYNTTFHVAKGHDENLLKFLRTTFIPQAIASGTLTNPRLALILARAEGDDGTSYSVQFDAADIDSLRKWYTTHGETLTKLTEKEVGTHSVGFSTLMQQLDL